MRILRAGQKVRLRERCSDGGYAMKTFLNNGSKVICRVYRPMNEGVFFKEVTKAERDMLRCGAYEFRM